MNYIIGCGGVGSWLCPSLCLLTEPELVVLVDGDTLEEKNMNRQLFTLDCIGKNKAKALGQLWHCGEAYDYFYNAGCVRHDPSDWLLVCVDNNPARMAALTACDRFRCRAIFAANEVTSAEAYVYLPSWKGTRLDPRVMYPDMVADHTNDPQAAAVGCTGEAQKENRQLVSANFMAASLLQHLYVAWAVELPQLSAGMEQHLPHKLVANASKIESFKTGTI